MLPIQQYITPVAQAEFRPQNYSAVGDLGEFLAKLSAEEKDRQEKQRQFNENMGQRQFEEHAKNYNEGVRNAQNQQHIEGTNRYYDMQAETHRMGVEDAKTARGEKRLAMLRDALRKAKTVLEKRNILEQMAQETGGSIEEVPREGDAATIPQVGSEQPAEAPATPGPKGKGAKAPKVPPWLSQFMTTAAAGQSAPGAEAGSDVAAPPEASAPSGSVSPFPWAQFGIEAPPPTPEQLRAANASPGAAPKSPAAKTGRFVLKDKDGNIVDIFDESQETKDRQARMLAVMRPYIKDPENPQSQAAAQRAASAAAELTSVMPEDQAAKAGLEQYNKEMGGFKKQALPGKGGSGTGAPSLKERKFETETENQIINRVGSHYNAKAADETGQFARMALSKMDLATGTGDFSAFADWLKSESGKVVTDREREQFMSSAGGFTGLQNKINRWTNNGRFDPKYMGEVRQMMETILHSIEEKRQRAADIAKGEAKSAGLSSSAQDVVGGHFTGKFAGAPSSGGDDEAARKKKAFEELKNLGL